jgi:hypothetical protein
MKPTYKEFLQLCKDADELIRELPKGPSKLQSKHRNTIKAAAVWHLAQQRGLHITSNDIFHIYGIYQPKLIEIRKLINKEAKRHP